MIVMNKASTTITRHARLYSPCFKLSLLLYRSSPLPLRLPSPEPALPNKLCVLCTLCALSTAM